jgi:hypothetical protein
MKAVKPEWGSLQAEFTPLSLSARLSCIMDELKALQHEMDVKSSGALGDAPSSLYFMLRKIQRYVEWTVPELLPDRAEDAETLVDVNRFAARLLIQKEAWNTSNITTEIEHQIQWISAIRNVALQNNCR